MWVDTPDLSGLDRLAGMAFHGGKSREHWRALVGADPADFPGLIRVDSLGRCWWLPSAEAAYQRRVSAVRGNFGLLDVR